MPVADEANGLLPGRGPDGRGPLGVGRPAPSPGAAGVSVTAGAGATVAAAAAGSTGDSTGAGGAGASTATAAAGASTGASTTWAAAAFFAGALRGAAPPSPAGGAGYISRSLRTTGGSTVDDADRTNSPSSLSLAITTLLSIPSSLASS